MTTDMALTDGQCRAASNAEDINRAQRKFCGKCATVKPYDQFNKRTKAKDGLQSNCRACSAAQYLENREPIRARQRETWADYAIRNRGRLAEKDRKRRRENKLLDAEYRKAYKIRFAPKIAAKNAVRSMVLTGRMTQKPCEICGDGPADAHHDDYAEPLSVRWLCRVHHAEWHAINGEAPNDRASAAIQEQP
jgi:ribosomal protein S27AE